MAESDENIGNASENRHDLGLLIEVIQGYEHIYNLKHKDYRNSIKKEQPWQEIAGILNMSVDECKRHWKNLRDKYMREKREKPSGSSAPESTWEFMKQMTFYGKFCKPRKTSTATPLLSEIESEPSPSCPAWDSIDTIMSPIESPRMSPVREEAGSDREQKAARTKGLTPNSKQAEKMWGDDVSEVVTAAKHIAESIQTQNTPKNPTPNEVFSNYVLMRLNEMSPEESRNKRRELLKVLEDLN